MQIILTDNPYGFDCKTDVSELLNFLVFVFLKKNPQHFIYHRAILYHLKLVINKIITRLPLLYLII
jgi:hypothetical protein